MPTAVWLAALAIALTSCTIETRYVPRTPHRLALGMRNREVGFYLDGKLISLSDAEVTVAACSSAASADLAQAVLREGSRKSNTTVFLVFDTLGAVVAVLAGPGYALPVLGLGYYFLVRADRRREQSYADVVDAINRFNDDPRCAP
jgi:hypothetical protein